MQIFNVQIFGSDKEQWLSQTVEEKVEWIRKYTNQQNDAIIEEFVNNPKISKDRICLTCGLDKQKEEVIVTNEILDSLEKSSNALGLSEEQHNTVVDSVTKMKNKSKRR